MRLLMLLWCFTLCTADTLYATHWMVTEKGLIKSKVKSHFALAQPYDLLAFLDQESRWHSIHSTYEDLVLRQANLDKLWSQLENDTEIAKEIASHDVCHKAGQLQHLDWYASYLEDGSSKRINEEDYELYRPEEFEDRIVPTCERVSTLTFSMYAFEHLEGMTNRQNLTIEAELTLPKIVAPIMNLDQFGHYILTSLRKNNTSWLHYNLASMYWRLRGNASKALECSRRAVHYCPKSYEDIPLLSMGTIFHRAKKPHDAIIVLKVALKNNNDCAHCHFTMANAYALTGDFKKALEHYDTCLKLDAGIDQAIRNRFGVLCVEKVLQKMDNVSRSFIQMRQDLSEYNDKENLWIKNMTLFLNTMKQEKKENIYYDYNKNLAKVTNKMSEVTGLNIEDLILKGGKYRFLKFMLDGSSFEEGWKEERNRGISALDAAYGFKRIVNAMNSYFTKPDQMKLMTELHNVPIESKTLNEKDTVKESVNLNAKDTAKEASSVEPENRYKSKLSEQSQNEESCESSSQPQKHPKTETNTENKEPEDADFEKWPVLYPNYIVINRNTHDFDKNVKDWPEEDICVDDNLPDNINFIYPLFLPFENKGLSLEGVLTERIGVPLLEEHELPWRPPHCSDQPEATPKNWRYRISVEVSSKDLLKHYLLKYAGDGRSARAEHRIDAELGERIVTAMEKKVAPKWMLYTLSSLYWRVRDNNENALSCLITARQLVTSKHKDVVGISLASVYLEMGFLEEAWQTVTEIYKQSLYEPITNLLLAEIHMLKQNHNTQLFHLKQVVRVASTGSFISGLARELLVGWACVMKEEGTLRRTPQAYGGMYCTPIADDLMMVCRPGQKHCELSSHCPETIVRGHLPGESTYDSLGDLFILRSNEFNRLDRAELNKLTPDLFKPIVIHMPKDRNEKESHERNFARLVSLINEVKGCGDKSCGRYSSTDLKLDYKKCRYQYLQLLYWTESYGFWEFMRVPEFKLPPQIEKMSPSKKMIPDCKVLGDVSQDFYLNRISQVPVHDWEPLVPLLKTMLNQYDNKYQYAIMGAMISAYIEATPRSWLGLSAAAWWCGARGRAECCVRCVMAASSVAPKRHHSIVLRMLAAFLHLQDHHKEAQEISNLAFYASGPRSVHEALFVGISAAFMEEYSKSLWMYRYAMVVDPTFLPPRACMHATMCLLVFGENAIPKYQERPELEQ